MQKLTNRQKQLKSEYMKIYRRLDKFGQAPMQPLTNPWQRDVERLKQRYQTVHEYEKIYRRFERSVKSFNEIYKQNIGMPQPHTRIDSRTLQTLQQKYEEFKQFRRRFVRKIPREDETVYKNLIKLLSDVISMHNSPNRFTGTLSSNDERIIRNAYRLRDIITAIFPKRKIRRNKSLRRIKIYWAELVEAVEAYVYGSDQKVQEESLNVIIYIITGDNELYTDMTGMAEEDEYFE